MTTLTGLLITPDRLETVTIEDANHLTGIQQAIACDTFDVVGCEDDIDLFVDDEGLITGRPLNLPLTIIAHALGRPTALFGTGLALRSNPTTGATLSLTPEQQGRIIAVLRNPPDATTVDEVTATLAPFPGIAALLRNW